MAQQCFPRYPLEEKPVGNMSLSKEHTDAIPYDSIDPGLLSLAMGFVPKQIWETPYDHESALSRGTIFPSLDKPYRGWDTAHKQQKGVLR